MTHEANAVTTKSRAMYGRMLTPNQLGDLSQKQSVQEISAYLRSNTSYVKALEDVQDFSVHRGQIEKLLRQDVFHQYVRIMRYAGGENEFYRYVIMDLETEIIMSCLRGFVSGKGTEFVAGLPTFVQPFVSFDIISLIPAKNPEDLMRILKGTPYVGLLASITDKTDYAECEFVLRKYYFETLLSLARKTAKGKALEQLSELILTRAEITNLNMIFRMKAYFNRSPEQIQKRVLPFNLKISPRVMLSLVQAKDANEFIEVLIGTTYGKKSKFTVDGFFEQETDKIRFGLAHNLIRFATDPAVVYTAFMLLRQLEVDNIVRIIEGVRYGVAPDKIKSLLLFV